MKLYHWIDWNTEHIICGNGLYLKYSVCALWSMFAYNMYIRDDTKIEKQYGEKHIKIH